MAKYKVHIYAVVRVPVEVEAETEKVATKLALEFFDMNHEELIKQDGEYAHEVQNVVVVDRLDPDTGLFSQVSVRDTKGNPKK